MSSGLEVNVNEMFDKFKQLTAREMDSAIKKAMKAAANEIKNQTLSNARAGIKTYDNHPDDPYNGDTILDAVKVTKIEDRYDGELSMKVHVMGTNKSDSQTYRFRFLEGGTKDRYSKTYKGQYMKKQKYLGRITPRKWFDTARKSVNVENIYLQTISNAIDKINSESI
jgi:HK97 gp10 family phage protein